MSIIDDPTAWTGWALGADGARLIEQALERRRPRYVLEAGSGSSTVALGEYARRNPRPTCRVISLESDPGYLAATRAMLVGRGVAHCVDLRLVPLTGYQTPFGRARWYETRDLPPGIDFALIDGPPGHHSEGRLATLTALRDLLAPNFELWLDDVQRPGEKRSVALWAAYEGVTVEVILVGGKQMAKVTR